MTPKEKAEDLRRTFSDILFDEIEGYYQKNHIIKLCALASIDNIMDSIPSMFLNVQEYWLEVKQEIELL